MDRQPQREVSDRTGRRGVVEDREWGWCRRVTPELRTLLERKMLWQGDADHVVVLVTDARTVILVYWRGDRPIGYRMADASVGRDVRRLGASESA